jgi:acyl-coenzyme A synthetase/AMP-(fatty) acid ligase
LWRAVQSLAAAIQAVTSPDAMVLALVKSDVYFPVMLFGAHLAGRPIVLQDATNPIDRQNVIFDEVAAVAGVVLVAPGSGLDTGYISSGVPRITVDLDPPGPIVPIRRSVGQDEFFAILFTSGSTNRPKGSAHGSHTMALYAQVSINQLQLSSDDIVLCVGSPSTLGLRDALISLLSGARLRLLDIKQAGLPEAFRVLAEEKITILNLVPSVLRAVMRIPGAERAFATLRVLGVAGEPMSKDDLILFRSKLPPKCEINFALAMTEAGEVFHWLVRDDAVEGPGVPPGFLAEGRRIMVADEEGRPVEQGQVGELVLSDDYVALGDWVDNRIDTTRFPTDPSTGKRVYASGDLVRMRSDGLFEFAGRRDRMVKVLGQRANLAEIETVLNAVPGISDAVVVASARDDNPSRVAFVVLQPGIDIDDRELRRRAAQGAAPHMTPTAIHRLDVIPRLHNGKPDLVRLRSIAESADRSSR